MYTSYNIPLLELFNLTNSQLLDVNNELVKQTLICIVPEFEYVKKNTDCSVAIQFLRIATQRLQKAQLDVSILIKSALEIEDQQASKLKQFTASTEFSSPHRLVDQCVEDVDEDANGCNFNLFEISFNNFFKTSLVQSSGRLNVRIMLYPTSLSIIRIQMGGTFSMLTLANGFVKNRMLVDDDKMSPSQKRILFGLGTNAQLYSKSDTVLHIDDFLYQRIKKWNQFYKATLDCQIEKYSKVSQMMCKEYPIVKTHEHFLKTCKQILKIIPIQHLRKLINKERYQIECLTGKSYILTLQSILELQQLLKTLPKYCSCLQLIFNALQQRSECQIIILRKQQIQSEIEKTKRQILKIVADVQKVI